MPIVTDIVLILVSLDDLEAGVEPAVLSASGLVLAVIQNLLLIHVWILVIYFLDVVRDQLAR